MNAREMSGPTRYDRRMQALMNRPEGRGLYATSGRRRLVVGTHIALTAVGAGAWIAGVFTEAKWPLFVTLGVLLPWCLATGLINAATRGLLELRGRVLDERQRVERDQVLARSHRTTSLLLAAAALVVLAVGRIRDVTPQAALVPVLAGVFVVHWMMPLWTAGLLVRDDPADD
ncbi:hypothetical protein HY68_06295 [Streptomyces sp. AcH 505]|uniref:hypothetical protein n=1 Tax=Streptomyces sp. AcH 505 TaxID=352211 RepID=UPI0005921EC4|nr:hypothetical protein HY68_06295 [Streptomyces sp. AcH 505]